jgi:hypothetical protein
MYLNRLVEILAIAMADACKHDNKSLDPIKYDEFIVELNKYQLFK